MLIVFTAIVGTLLAVPGMPPLSALIWGNLGIALASACAATINHVLDQKIDEKMARTRARPMPTGMLGNRQALTFAAVLGVASMLILWFLVNPLTAVLTFISLIGYAIIYTELAEARHIAEYRYWRCRRRGSSGVRLGCGDEFDRPKRLAAVSHHLHLDAAAFLGTRHRAA